jgi:type II secretory ATPase GspE/PulE/Tfp pilus assembly ATPase PilB-like protein
MALLVIPGVAAAGDGAFPRGPGFYFSIPKMLLFLLVYLAWVRTCWWVDRDTEKLDQPRIQWNLITFGCGAAGLFIVWLLPWFWISLPVALCLYLGPTFVYAHQRNQLVPEEEKVLTGQHMARLAQQYLGIGRKEKVKDDRGPPLRFIAKSFNQTDEDPNRVARAAASKGYKIAREMVYEAIEARATDIHMEPTKDEMSVRFRIDGILQATAPFSRHMGDSVINIFKVLGALDITEKRKPQDGSFSAQVEERNVDFRVATAGSVMGEKLVMRILDKAKQLIDLTQLGMRDRMREQIHEIARQPHGMLIVCGPTGAGKSTTLYACLNEIDRYQTNVITVENPVEYQINNVTQIEINPKAGKTFATELRSILRQDPDVILVGEIRDQETAEIACQAAQTGHMVFSTLHANDTVTAVARLIDLGVAPFLVASALTAVLGQRLVRMLCPRCKIRYKPNADLLRKLNLPADKIKYFYRPPEPGEYQPPEEERRRHRDDEEPPVCPRCGGSGYFGRTGIFELLVTTDRIRDLMQENPNLNAIRQEAIKNGMRYLQEDGLRQVIEGKTSIQELLRVSK